MVTFDYKKTPITQIADYIIMYSAKSGASDIHFDPRENGLMVRIRIDGELQDYTLIPPDYERNLITRLKLLANMNITESRLPQDGAIKGTFGRIYLDMRVSCLPTNEGEKIVIRILDYSRSLQGLEHLGFSKENFIKLKRMIAVPNGIILVTGATGSGKSTTTYSILQELNKPETNIITVEDPVEMNIEGLNQVQVNSEIGLDFATVLRSILRQDPNVILIGEIRDSETAKIAVRASITGHFVLSTIHTNNSLSTIERLLDMDVERYLLSSALTGIISQRLAKMLCPKCRIKREATPYEKKIFKNVLNQEVTELYDANVDGCNDCHHGYKGRIAVQEVLEIDDDIRDSLNNENLTKEDRREMIYTSNVITLLQDGLSKVLDGITSFEEIYRIIEIDSDSNEDYGAELALANKERLEQKKLEEKKKENEEITKQTGTNVVTNTSTIAANTTKTEENTTGSEVASPAAQSIIKEKKKEINNTVVIQPPSVPVFIESNKDVQPPTTQMIQPNDLENDKKVTQNIEQPLNNEVPELVDTFSNFTSKYKDSVDIPQESPTPTQNLSPTLNQPVPTTPQPNIEQPQIISNQQQNIPTQQTNTTTVVNTTPVNNSIPQ